MRTATLLSLLCLPLVLSGAACRFDEIDGANTSPLPPLVPEAISVEFVALNRDSEAIFILLPGETQSSPEAPDETFLPAQHRRTQTLSLPPGTSLEIRAIRDDSELNRLTCAATSAGLRVEWDGAQLRCYQLTPEY